MPHVRRAGNQATAHINGPTYHAALSQAISNAYFSIALTTHTFDDSPATTAIVDQLIAKARQGLVIALLIDWFGCDMGREPKNVDRLRAAGVHVAMMHKHVLGPRLFEVNHTKLGLIDGRVGFVGGQNFSSGGFSRHDLTLEVKGPVLADIQGHFDLLWLQATGRRIRLAGIDPTSTGTLPVRVLETTPDNHEFRTVALRAIDAATHHINIEQAYMTDPDVIEHLEQAARRGVTVTMIITAKADEWIIDNMLRASLNSWLQAGIDVYRYPPDLHTKAISVDGVWATVGSTNTCHRGLVDNFELSLALSDPTEVQRLDHDLFAADVAVAERVTPEKANQLRGDFQQQIWDSLLSVARHFN